jgi:hypothetical protein
MHVGFIAEDVEQVDKRIAAYKGNGELAGVDYDHATAIDTAAIQDVQKEVVDLKQLIATQARAIAELKGQIQTLAPAH